MGLEVGFALLLLQQLAIYCQPATFIIFGTCTDVQAYAIEN